MSINIAAEAFTPKRIAPLSLSIQAKPTHNAINHRLATP